MVSLLITTTELGCIVRFQREVWSDRLGRNYLSTDLIIIIDPVLEQDLRNDFSLYRQLDVTEQMIMIETLKYAAYAGRMLSDVVSPVSTIVITPRTEEIETQQFALF